MPEELAAAADVAAEAAVAAAAGTASAATGTAVGTALALGGAAATIAAEGPVVVAAAEAQWAAAGSEIQAASDEAMVAEKEAEAGGLEASVPVYEESSALAARAAAGSLASAAGLLAAAQLAQLLALAAQAPVALVILAQWLFAGCSLCFAGAAAMRSACAAEVGERKNALPLAAGLAGAVTARVALAAALAAPLLGIWAETVVTAAKWESGDGAFTTLASLPNMAEQWIKAPPEAVNGTTGAASTQFIQEWQRPNKHWRWNRWQWQHRNTKHSNQINALVTNSTNTTKMPTQLSTSKSRPGSKLVPSTSKSVPSTGKVVFTRKPVTSTSKPPSTQGKLPRTSMSANRQTVSRPTPTAAPSELASAKAGQPLLKAPKDAPGSSFESRPSSETGAFWSEDDESSPPDASQGFWSEDNSTAEKAEGNRPSPAFWSASGRRVQSWDLQGTFDNVEQELQGSLAQGESVVKQEFEELQKNTPKVLDDVKGGLETVADKTKDGLAAVADKTKDVFSDAAATARSKAINVAKNWYVKAPNTATTTVTLMTTAAPPEMHSFWYFAHPAMERLQSQLMLWLFPMFSSMALISWPFIAFGLVTGLGRRAPHRRCGCEDHATSLSLLLSEAGSFWLWGLSALVAIWVLSLLLATHLEPKAQKLKELLSPMPMALALCCGLLSILTCIVHARALWQLECDCSSESDPVLFQTAVDRRVESETSVDSEPLLGKAREAEAGEASIRTLAPRPTDTSDTSLRTIASYFVSLLLAVLATALAAVEAPVATWALGGALKSLLTAGWLLAVLPWDSSSPEVFGKSLPSPRLLAAAAALGAIALGLLLFLLRRGISDGHVKEKRLRVPRTQGLPLRPRDADQCASSASNAV